jgi:hypothetical protein
MAPGEHDLDRWETAFVAVSVITGEPLDAIAVALGETGRAGAAGIVRALGSTSREARARALAQAISHVALAIDALRYA